MRDYSKIDSDLNFIQMASLLNPIFRQIIDYGGTCYHGGLIEYQGQGILLSGPSGTGKSTCCRRIPSPWQALSDDECLISWHDQHYQVQPLPTWSAFWKPVELPKLSFWRKPKLRETVDNLGIDPRQHNELIEVSLVEFDSEKTRQKKTWDTSRVLPLRAIFLLQQGNEDKASPVTSGEAVISLVREALGPFFRAVSAQQRQDADIIHYRTQIFNNICHLAKTVPVYDLSVRKDGEFWREIERVLG